MTLNELTVNFKHLESENILSDWMWLIGKNKVPVLITAFGDVFVQDSKNGQIYFLNVYNAELIKVSKNSSEFRQQLNDKEFVYEHMVANAVGDLRQSGKVLGKGQTYSFIKPPVLGGEYVPENIEMTDIEVHFSIMGQIHRQVKDLPEGTEVGSFTIESDGKPWWKFWG
jgi:hypothetical protein